MIRFLSLLALAFSIPALLAAQSSYHSYDELSTRLESISSSSGGRVSVRSLGTTAGKREIWQVTIGSGKSDERPAILVVGGIEGNTPVGSELALRFIERLAADRSDSVRALLERTTFYVIPRASPDEIEQHFSSVRYQRSGNASSTDDDRDGARDEDGVEDLDGNGIITLMRVRDAAGRYLPDTGDARFMHMADASKGERGIYSIYSEGRDNDGDGRFNEDGAGGVAFNRNFTYNYPFFKPGAGAYQMSEVESRAVADFCYDHPNIAVVVGFGPQNNLVNPWEPRPGEGPAGRGGGRIVRSVRDGDVETMKRVAAIYSDITGLKEGPSYQAGEGSFIEWAYYHYGRLAFGTNGWWMKVDAQKSGDSAEKEKRPSRGGRGGAAGAGSGGSGADTLRWLESQGNTNAFVPWKKISHPDFPDKEVEIGGLAPFLSINPPAKMLDSLGDLHTRFIVELGELMPRIEIASLKSEKLAGGVTRITAEVVNTGYLPTLSAMGQTSRVPLDIKAELKLSSNQTVASGRRVQLLGPIDGSGGVKTLTWVVTGNGSITLDISGPMVEGVERRIEN